MTARDVIAKALRDNTRVQMSLHCADAILAALEAAGFTVVPKEPTEAMRRAGESAPNTRLASHVWRAMLAAAKETT